jgi:hypothetical protein
MISAELLEIDDISNVSATTVFLPKGDTIPGVTDLVVKADFFAGVLDTAWTFTTFSTVEDCTTGAATFFV